MKIYNQLTKTTKINYLVLVLWLTPYLLTAQENYSTLSYKELDTLGAIEEKKGNYEKAISLMTAAKEKSKAELGDKSPVYARIISKLGLVYYHAGGFKEAEHLYLEAKEIYTKAGLENNVDFASVLDNLASLYLDMSNYEKAETLIIQAQEITKKSVGTNHAFYGVVTGNVGIFYHTVHQYEKAEPYYKEAIEIQAKVIGKMHPDYASSLNNLAMLYTHTRQFEKAEPLLLESTAIEAKILGKEHPGYATNINNLGGLYITMGNFQKAEKFFLEAVSLRSKTLGTEHPMTAQSLNNLTDLYYRLGAFDSALVYFNKSMDANSLDITNNQWDWTSLDKFSYYSNISATYFTLNLQNILKAQYYQTGDKSKLEMFYQIVQATMRLNENVRNNFSSEEDKLRILSTNSYFVREGIKTALLLGLDVHKHEAFSFAEINKSALLADAIKSDKANALGDLPDSLIAQEALLQNQLTNLKNQQVEAKTPEQKSQINAALTDLNLQIDAFLKSIKTQYPKYHALKYQNITAQASDVQKLLDDKTALLEYFLSDSVVFLFVVTQKNLELYPIKIPIETLREKIQLMRRALSDYVFITKDENRAYEDYAETAFWFYKNILEIGLDKKNLQNLIIITDGELGHLPFETFLVEQAPQKKEGYKNLHYLVKDYSISYNYSATLLLESRQESNQKKNNPSGQMLACAGTYAAHDGKNAVTRAPYFVNLRQTLQPLPAAQEEIKRLSEKFNGNFLLENDANEGFFKKNASDYSIIHLAMHGVLDAEQPMLSSLVFTENKDSLDDNFLQAFEIARLKLNADLVVLSACETGYGKFLEGEGVISLARSFMYAGVPSLVVSLWQVNDHSTAAVMENFYKYLAEGMTKDMALRQAKLDYINVAQGVAAHPAFWSPFIQLGDSQAIYLKKKSGWLWWLVGGAVVALGGGAFAMRRFSKQ